jgi:hypothetical protein
MTGILFTSSDKFYRNGPLPHEGSKQSLDCIPLQFDKIS